MFEHKIKQDDEINKQQLNHFVFWLVEKMSLMLMVLEFEELLTGIGKSLEHADQNAGQNAGQNVERYKINLI